MWGSADRRRPNTLLQPDSANGFANPIIADSDEAGHAFQSEAGHLFRSDAGRGSDLMSATMRRRYGSMDNRFCWLFGQADGSV
jgi:hypothetical protein